MQPNYTPETLARLAEVLGITPETHPHMLKAIGWALPSHTSTESGRPNRWALNLPTPDSPGGDALWLAPLWQWFQSSRHDAQLGIIKGAPSYASVWQGGQPIDADVETTTADALIRAALAAGVEQVVKIMEGE